MKSGRRRSGVLWIVAAVLLLLTAAGTVYVGDYYHASPEAAALLTEDLPGITVSAEKGRIVFRPEDPAAGLIFYPGGKVEHTAYAPLMAEFARRGFLCVLIDMPLRLAFLNINAADAVYADFPEIDRWFLAGHSLGGVAGGAYAAGHADKLSGLILLASYTTSNLKESGIKVLSVYGSEDGVLNLEAYAKNRSNLPGDSAEVIIPGGCHAYFGSYGDQKGDGLPSISGVEQIRFTADAAAEWAGL